MILCFCNFKLLIFFLSCIITISFTITSGSINPKFFDEAKIIFRKTGNWEMLKEMKNERKHLSILIHLATVKCLLISRQKSWQFQKIQHSICVDSFANRSDNLVAVQGKKTDSKTKATLTTDKCKCKTYLNPKRQDFCYQLLNKALICWSPWMWKQFR